MVAVLTPLPGATMYATEASVDAASVSVAVLVQAAASAAEAVQADVAAFVAGLAASASLLAPEVGADGFAAIAKLTTTGAGGADPADVWSYVLPNGKTAGDTFAELHTWLTELRLVHGLVPGQPLVVTPSSRQAGTLAQTVTTTGDTVTVNRGS